MHFYSFTPFDVVPMSLLDLISERNVYDNNWRYFAFGIDRQWCRISLLSRSLKTVGVTPMFASKCGHDQGRRQAQARGPAPLAWKFFHFDYWSDQKSGLSPPWKLKNGWGALPLSLREPSPGKISGYALAYSSVLIAQYAFEIVWEDTGYTSMTAWLGQDSFKYSPKQP